MPSITAADGHRTAQSRLGPIDIGFGAAALGAALALSLALLNGWADRTVHPGPGALGVFGLAVVALSAAPVIGWRRAPLGVFVLTASASTLLAGFDYPMGFPVGPTVALYLLAASREEASPWTKRSTAIVMALLVSYLAAVAAARGRFPGIELFHIGLAWSAAWFAGERARLRREQLAELAAGVAAAEREAERDRLLAVAQERARIARDLHDSAGHAINVIAVRAGAARLRHYQDSDRSLAALEAIEDLARHTAAEIDHFVGALRHRGPDDNALKPTVETPPGLASLGSLVAQHAASGLEVTLGTDGPPRPLTSGADQAAFRILQEALTNAARHGVGTARVDLGFGDDALEVTVTNPVPAGSVSRASGGHGLIGMRERATLLGGDLVTERSGGAFRVSARLPYEANYG